MILETKQKAIKKVEDKIKDTYKEHEKILSIFLLLLIDYFDKYSIGERFSVNRHQRRAILKDVERRIIKEIKAFGYREVEFNKRVLGEIIKDTYKSHYDFIGGDKNILLNPFLIQDIIFRDYKGDRIDNRIINNKKKLANRLYKGFDKALINNDTLGETSKELKGIFNKSKYESYRLLMNEQARVFNAVQTKIFIDESTIEKVMWVSVLCPNTCPYCEMMDGSVFDINDSSRPEIPAHVLCQCYWIPV
ncbi:minor capsid protein [Dethiothermospora halolimnae]|uniref:minor capsid protein n=1 Tax=Dethiothermospora halolimnae TaxID=3114390 RepID=UPI003CCB8AA7